MNPAVGVSQFALCNPDGELGGEGDDWDIGLQ